MQATTMPMPNTFFHPAELLAYKPAARIYRSAGFRTNPQEISEEDYLEAFSVLPPMKYHSLGGVDSFRMTEFYSGQMTYIYAHCQGRYWRFIDDAYMKTDAIVAKVRAAQGLPTWVREI